MTNTAIPALNGPMLIPSDRQQLDKLIVFLHGYGADGEDLISLAQFFAERFPDAGFASPHAPFPCEMSPFGRQWFSLLNRDPHVLLEGVRTAQPILNAYLDGLLQEFSLKPAQLALVGFSQGAMMSMYCAPRREEPIAGVVAYSGVLHGGALLKDEILSRPPVCLIHGDHDEVVPYSSLALSKEALQAAGIQAEAHTRPGLGHGIDPEGIRIAVDFLAEQWKK